jgi:hypothetical protein
MKKVLEKLKQARDIIKSSDLKKSGRNDYSKFDYYTPEQVEALVDKACKDTNSIVLCNLKADEFGLYQTLDFIDLETEEKVSFEMRTKHGSITATNETQQMGGTDTYSERYIKMKVFQIKDNNLDIDSQDNRPKQEVKPVLLEEIKKLGKDNGFTGKTMEEFGLFIFSKTSYTLETKNYQSIIEKLKLDLIK